MFGYRQGPKIESIIGRKSEFKGTLKAKESVYIDGELGGKVQVEAEVIVGKDAVVKADIQAESVTIKGKVIGNVDCQRDWDNSIRNLHRHRLAFIILILNPLVKNGKSFLWNLLPS